MSVPPKIELKEIKYDKRSDILTLIIGKGQVVGTSLVAFGVQAGYDQDRRVLSFIIQNASEHIEDVEKWGTGESVKFNQAIDRLAAAISQNIKGPIP